MVGVIPRNGGSKARSGKSRAYAFERRQDHSAVAGTEIRGMRHKFRRPALIVVDDPEVLDWVRTKENRDKSEQWLLGEVIPAMDVHNRKMVLIGNFLHDDCLLARMKDKMDMVLQYPLAGDYRGTDPEGLAEHCSWPDLYPTPESIEKLAEIVGPESFSREYLLRVVPPGTQVIKPEDIHYYDNLPESYREEGGLEHIVDSAGFVGHGMDCAISTKQTADFTAIVDGEALLRGRRAEDLRAPEPVGAARAVSRRDRASEGVARRHGQGGRVVRGDEQRRRGGDPGDGARPDPRRSLHGD